MIRPFGHLAEACRDGHRAAAVVPPFVPEGGVSADSRRCSLYLQEVIFVRTPGEVLTTGNGEVSGLPLLVSIRRTCVAPADDRRVTDPSVGRGAWRGSCCGT